MIAAAVTTVGAWVVAGGAVLTVAGLAVFGAFLIADPKLAELLKITNESLVKEVKAGLDHIAEQAKNVEIMLNFIYKEYMELAIGAPDADLPKGFGGKPRVSRLVDSLLETQKNLKKLEADIISTEQVIDTELQVYTKKVYKPLLDMYHS